MQHSAASRAIPVSIGALIAALAMVLLFVAPASADATLTAVLTGDQEVCDPADTCDDPGGAGVGIVDIIGDDICVSLTWSLTDPPATAAHIHEAPVGVAGPVVLLLFMDPDDPNPDPDGSFDGCFTDATLAAEIEADPAAYYLNIHNAEYPNGAIRGQLAVSAAAEMTAYINPDTGLATENPDVPEDSDCDNPTRADTQTVSASGGVENNVHIDACLTDALGLDVDTTVSYQSSGVGVISACPDPDMDGPKESSLSSDGLLCTLDGYQESDGAMGGDFEYHARVNSEVAGTQTVVVCADPGGDGCGTDDTILDTIVVTWVAAAAEPETGMLMIMKHYCNADDSNPDTTVDVRSEEEFMEVEAGGGDNEVIAVALTILACPVERLPGDEPAPDSIAHFEEEFDFLVTDSTGATFTLDDATFNQALVCEQDKEVASGPDPIVIGEVDGDEATNVCVDFSFYSIDGVAEGEVTVVETFHEGEHEFGTVRFTPAALDPDDDSRTLLGFNRETSTVLIDTSRDDDAMAMLHIYNFDTAGDAAPAPTATPVASELPDAAADATGIFGSSGIAILFGIMALASVGFLGYRTVAVRRTR